MVTAIVNEIGGGEAKRDELTDIVRSEFSAGRKGGVIFGFFL